LSEEQLQNNDIFVNKKEETYKNSQVYYFEGVNVELSKYEDICK